MPIKTFIYLTLLVFSASACALPKFSVKHQRNFEDFAEIQLTNDTIEPLVCFVAIDGHKIYFRLQARQISQWYKATDKRFHYTHFSTWCDYLSLYPQHQPKIN